MRIGPRVCLASRLYSSQPSPQTSSKGPRQPWEWNTAYFTILPNSPYSTLGLVWALSSPAVVSCPPGFPCHLEAAKSRVSSKGLFPFNTHREHATSLEVLGSPCLPGCFLVAPWYKSRWARSLIPNPAFYLLSLSLDELRPLPSMPHIFPQPCNREPPSIVAGQSPPLFSNCGKFSVHPPVGSWYI